MAQLSQVGVLTETIRLWDAETGASKTTLTGHSDTVSSVAFSPNGATLASGSWDGTIRLWDAETGAPKATLTGHRNNVSSVAFSPNGAILASGGGWDETIRLWDAETGVRKATLTGHRGSVYSVAFRPNGATLASGSFDETIRLWELPTTRVNITPYPVDPPAIGEQFTINLSIVEGENVGGYQFTVGFDETILRYVGSANGNYLPPGSFFVPPVVSENAVTLSTTSLTGVSNGDGTLATVTFEVLDVKESPIALSDLILTDSAGKHLSVLTNSSRIEPTLSSSLAL